MKFPLIFLGLDAEASRCAERPTIGSMSPRYVALLRGIGPSDPKMRSAALRDVFERLGFDRVRTVISSGNVVFDTAERSASKLESRIEEAMHDHLGSPCSTVVRSERQIRGLLALGVFDAYDDGPAARCNVTFLKRRPKTTIAVPRVAPDGGSTVLDVRDQVVFSVVDTTASKTPDLMAWLEKVYGKEITTRTWRTVHRIAKASED